MNYLLLFLVNTHSCHPVTDLIVYIFHGVYSGTYQARPYTRIVQVS